MSSGIISTSACQPVFGLQVCKRPCAVPCLFVVVVLHALHIVFRRFFLWSYSFMTATFCLGAWIAFTVFHRSFYPWFSGPWGWLFHRCLSALKVDGHYYPYFLTVFSCHKFRKHICVKFYVENSQHECLAVSFSTLFCLQRGKVHHRGEHPDWTHWHHRYTGESTCGQREGASRQTTG